MAAAAGDGLGLLPAEEAALWSLQVPRAAHHSHRGSVTICNGCIYHSGEALMRRRRSGRCSRWRRTARRRCSRRSRRSAAARASATSRRRCAPPFVITVVMGCSDELLTATRYSIALEVASVLEVCLRLVALSFQK